MKLTPSGGEIAVALRERLAGDNAPTGSVEITVRDTGAGNPAHKLPLIFDRFRQVDGSDTREHEGSGIGW